MEQEVILKEIKEYATKNYVPILQDISLDLILLVLKLKRPDSILEIGTAIGYSAINFSKYLKDKNSTILTIEKNADMYKKAVENIEKAGLSNTIEVIKYDPKQLTVIKGCNRVFRKN